MGLEKASVRSNLYLSLIENGKKILDKKGFGGAAKHALLLAKLFIYRFNNESQKFPHSYLSNTWQLTKVNKRFSSLQELIQRVPQGSALGPFFVNIYLNDFLYLVESTNVNLQMMEPSMHVIKT